MKRTKAEDVGLFVCVRKGRLVVEIGINTLAWAYKHREDLGPARVQVVDPLEFAKDVVHALLREREDGWTPISGLLDQCCDDAVSDGSLGVLYPDGD